jgi:hypothetical protein
MSRATCKHALVVLALLATFSVMVPAPALAASRPPGAKATRSSAFTWSSLWHYFEVLFHPLTDPGIDPDG